MFNFTDSENGEILERFEDGMMKQMLVTCGDYTMNVTYKRVESSVKTKGNEIANKINAALKEEFGANTQVQAHTFPYRDDKYLLKNIHGHCLNLKETEGGKEIIDMILDNKEVAVEILCGDLFAKYYRKENDHETN